MVKDLTYSLIIIFIILSASFLINNNYSKKEFNANAILETNPIDPQKDKLTSEDVSKTSNTKDNSTIIKKKENNSTMIELNQDKNNSADKKTIGGGSGWIAETKQIVSKDSNNEHSYLVHENITVTIFWAGEGAGAENWYISNEQSAWDDKWMQHYGGIDTPINRNGYHPSDFTPLQNPFYFALSYNDLNEGVRKMDATQIIYWSNDKEWNSSESICKNQWIKITKGNLSAFAQWEDVGPFNTNDSDYVFKGSNPNNTLNDNAGLDVSPAVRDYLSLEDIDKVDWQFVDYYEVQEGPWKEIITSSQIHWE